MKYLGNKGAEIDLQSMFHFSIYFVSLINLSCADKDGNSALIGAASNGHYDIVKYLGDQGAQLDFQSMFYFSLCILQFLINAIFSDKNDYSALIGAALNNHSDIVKYLGDKGADLDFQGMFHVYVDFISFIDSFV